MKKIIFIFALILLSLDFIHGKYNVVADFYLKNGLQVICIEKSNVPIVHFSILYKCGSNKDRISKSGVAHYLEHMAFCGDKGAFQEFLERVGAENNAYTSFNYVYFFEIVSIEHLERVFEYEARRMRCLDIDQEKFLAEKGAILEERNATCDNSPIGQALEAYMATVFNRSPCGIHTLGWRHEIESIEPKDLIEYQKKWFAPNNAVMLIVGKINIAKIKELAEKYFGDIEPKEIPETNKNRHKSEDLKEITLRSAKVGSRSVVNYVYFVPFIGADNFRKCLALDCVAAALNQPKSFAKRTLEDIFHKASNISFSYDPYYFNVFCVTISCSSINDLVESEKIWRYLKRRIVLNGISMSELNTVKRQEAISAAYRNDDIENIAQFIFTNLSGGLSMKQIQSIENTISSLTVNECTNVLKDVLSNDPMAIVRILPKEHDRD